MILQRVVVIVRRIHPASWFLQPDNGSWEIGYYNGISKWVVAPAGEANNTTDQKGDDVVYRHGKKKA